MYDINAKQKNSSSQKNENPLKTPNTNKGEKFVLSDISKEELNKRRIPVYPYLL